MKAMILAAGLGTRMRPLTLTTPKPLLPVADVPLIEYHIRRLVSAGFVDIVINHAWLGEQIEAAIGGGERFGARIEYSPEAEPLETAGGIRKALTLLTAGDDAHFLVVNGDVFTDYPFAKIAEIAEKFVDRDDQDSAYLVLVNNPEHNPEGDFYYRDGKLSPDIGAAYTFSGISLLPRQMFASLSPGQSEPLGPLLRAAIEAGEVSGELYQGYWLDVGTPERLAELDKLVREGQLNVL